MEKVSILGVGSYAMALADLLGHKGHPDVVTPNLDRLAAEGVRFENAITQNPMLQFAKVSRK